MIEPGIGSEQCLGARFRRRRPKNRGDGSRRCRPDSQDPLKIRRLRARDALQRAELPQQSPGASGADARDSLQHESDGLAGILRPGPAQAKIVPKTEEGVTKQLRDHIGAMRERQGR